MADQHKCHDSSWISRNADNSDLKIANISSERCVDIFFSICIVYLLFYLRFSESKAKEHNLEIKKSDVVSGSNESDARRRYLEVSTSVASDQCIDSISRIICFLVASQLPEYSTEELIATFRTSSVPSPPPDPSISPTAKLFNKIIKFFKFVRESVSITTAELAHALNLISCFLQNDSENDDQSDESVVDNSTIGTLFLCGVMISLKMNRDKALKNSFWSKSLHIPLSILNASELAFLEKIRFNLYLDESDYLEIYNSIFDS